MAGLGPFLLYALLPPIVMVAGGLIAIWREPPPALRSAILHFAAGVVFAVVAVEILPDIVREHQPAEVVLGFSLGVAAMLGIRRLSRGGEGEGSSGGGAPGALVAGIAVDITIDALLLGIAFAAGARAGELLGLALAAELLSLGLATGAALVQAGVSRRRIAGTLGGLGAGFAAVAIAGATLLRGLPEPVLAVVLAFGVAALLFLVTEELLVEAHEVTEAPLLTTAFFIGFLLFLLLGMLA